jgi:transcriptional regulator with XRE-family HTH domain
MPGLRREEVAMLSGISADYYLRLEQGRDRNPSVQVLEAIAGVLQLDDISRDHLLGLAAEKPRRPRRRAPFMSTTAATFTSRCVSTPPTTKRAESTMATATPFLS